ncbi:MAG: hypothetical protein R3C58_11880 [Parvularculaceae bacterium]
MAFGKRTPDRETSGATAAAPAKKPTTLGEMAEGLSVVEKAFCFWPLALILVGGAIGGALGGGAVALNFKIMQGSWPAPAKYALAVLTGVGALVLHIFVALVLALLFPDIFLKQG